MKQKIVIKVHMHCDKCRTKALKIAASADGVSSVAIAGSEKDKVVVVGEGIDAAELTRTLRKKVNCATIESIEEVKPPKSPAVVEPVKCTNPPWCDPRPCSCQLVVFDPDPPPSCSIL